MKQAIVVVSNRMGVHARPSMRIVKTAELFQSRITLSKGNESADAKSMISVLGLAMRQSEFVNIEAEGLDEDEAIKAIAGLFAQQFGEENIYD